MGGAFRGWIAAYLSRVRSTDGTLKPLAKELSRGFGQSPSLADTISPYEKEYGGCEVCFLIKSTAEEEPLVPPNLLASCKSVGPWVVLIPNAV